LPDSDVDADHVLAFLINDRIDGDGCFTRLAVTDDKLALPASIGTIASIAFSPVCKGSFTGCRSTMPGAMRSIV
jgi:hypothetical protein